MSAQEMSIKITTEGGKLRADLPATTIEAEDVAGLMRQFDLIVAAIRASVASGLQDAAEEMALREIEKGAPRRAALERLAARHPAPQQWFDEPE